MSVVFEHPRLTVPVSERDHVLGPATAPVTLVEYGDYECPFCRAAHASVEQVRQAMGNDLRFVFRHFPLSQIHPHAYQAAEAAEAAGAQGRFWEMHHLLFANQDRLGLRDLIGYAGALDLDLVLARAREGDGVEAADHRGAGVVQGIEPGRARLRRVDQNPLALQFGER